MDAKEQLHNKLEAENTDFISFLREQSADEILESAYHVVCYANIIAAFERGNYTERDYAAFNKQDDLLFGVFCAFMENENRDFSCIPSVIEQFAEREMGYKLGSIGDTDINVDVADEPDRETTWTDAINGRIECFSTVIATGDSDYPYFVGEVNAVKEYPGENKPDGVFVEFNSDEYSEERKREIEVHLGRKNGYFTPFDKLDLYNVLIPSNQLIAVPERDLPALLESREAAETYCNDVLSGEANLEAALIARVEQNYADYNKQMLTFGNRELIEMAAAIHAHSDAWSYMTEFHAYTDEEAQFYMQFENPLEIVADHWRERNIDVGDVAFTMEFIMEPERQKD